MEITDDIYETDLYSTIVYVKNIGTLCIGGYRKDQKVYIVTQNQDWQNINNSDKFLNEIEGTAYGYFGATVHENAVYLVGGFSSVNGYSAKNYVQFVDFDSYVSMISLNLF